MEELKWKRKLHGNDIPSFQKNNFPVKNSRGRMWVIIFFFICYQSLLKIRRNCIFCDCFCFNMNSVKYSIFFLKLLSPPKLALVQRGKENSASLNKQALLSWAPRPWKAHPLQRKSDPGQNRWRKKEQLLKHLVCFSPQPLRVPLLPSPLLQAILYPWAYVLETLSLEQT